jgi:hypothetical protein
MRRVQALVALQTAGLPVSDPAFQRGIRYLLSTQQDDGSTVRQNARPRVPAVFRQPLFVRTRPVDLRRSIQLGGDGPFARRARSSSRAGIGGPAVPVGKGTVVVPAAELAVPRS